MNRVMTWWYGDMLEHSRDLVEMLPSYAKYERQRPRIRFFRFRSGRPGGFWGIRKGHAHRAFGYRFYGGFGRLGWSVGLWPVWAMRFEGYLFPPARNQSAGEK